MSSSPTPKRTNRGPSVVSPTSPSRNASPMKSLARKLRLVDSSSNSSQQSRSFRKSQSHREVSLHEGPVKLRSLPNLTATSDEAIAPRLVSPIEEQQSTTTNMRKKVTLSNSIFQDESDSDVDRVSNLLEHAWESAEALLQVPMRNDTVGPEKQRKKKKDKKKSSSSSKHKKKYKVKESKILYSAKGTKSPRQKSSYRVYMLLLQPHQKLFELIQLVYDPLRANIADLIEMIPHHATEPALAQQTYVGVTRPHRHASLYYLQPPLSASNENTRNAGIQSRDILVAIPMGVDSSKLIKIAKQILASPSVQAVVEPKSAKKSKKSKRKERKSSLAIVDEKDDDTTSLRSGASSADPLASTLKRVVHKTLTATTPEKKSNMTLDSFFAKEQTSSTASVASIPNMGGQFDEVSVDDSLSSSYSNWSASFERSLSSRSMRWKQHLNNDQASVSSMTSTVTKRERRQQSQRTRQLVLQSFGALVVGMVAYYYADTNKAAATAVPSTLGLVGFVQLVVSFWLLFKVQRFYQQGGRFDGTSPCHFLRMVFECQTREVVDRQQRIHVRGIQV